MAKKKEETPPQNIIPTLTQAEYWEWRNACTQIWHSNYKVKLSEAEAKIIMRESEITALRLKLHNATSISDAKEESLNSGDEYRKIKEVLEKRLGTSLNGKIIDDVTLEVKDAPRDADSKQTL